MPAREPSNWRAWLRKADSDWLNVQNNVAAKRVPWDTVCFHAHQAVEKALKAFAVAKGGSVRRTHDLVALLSECAKHDATLARLEADCRRLDALSLGVRYPDDVSEPSEEDAREVMRLAEAIDSELRPRLERA